MNKTKIWLMGGLGNVLFQIFAKHVLEANGHNVELIENLVKGNILTRMAGWSIHEQSYQRFLMSGEGRCLSFPYLIFPVAAYVLREKKLFQNVFKYIGQDMDNSVVINPPLHLFGYFQSKQFLSRNQEVLNGFCNMIRKKCDIVQNDLCTVHFRKGDSTWAERYYTYYDYVREKVKNEQRKVRIVTDSVYEARNYFSNISNVEIHKSDDPIEDFITIASSSKIFCAPSTFSWWAAHCSNESRIVAPHRLENLIGFYVNQSKIEIV